MLVLGPSPPWFIPPKTAENPRAGRISLSCNRPLRISLTPRFSGVLEANRTSEPLQRFVLAGKPLKRLKERVSLTTPLKRGVNEREN